MNRKVFALHHDLKPSRYFEGWYFKQSQIKTGRSVSLIFGVSLNPSDAHAFIQVLRSHPLHSDYFRYPLEAFRQEGSGYRLGNSYFSTELVTLDIQDPSHRILARFEYSGLTPLPSSLWSPTIMGPFEYVPQMQCNHGVLSLSHRVNGSFSYDGEAWDFKNDIGYAEKDWGRSFPKRYLWAQANLFDRKDVSLMFSLADIPFGLFHFEGLILHLQLGTKGYRMATYTGVKKEQLKVSERGFSITLRQGDLTLALEAEIEESTDLASPHLGLMSMKIKEGLGGQIALTIKEREELLFKGTSHACGIELEGY